MKQFKIFSIYAVIFCLISLISCSSDSVTLKIKPAFLDFKEVNLGDFKEIEVSLTNRYDEDLTITDLKINGSTNFTISVGGTTPIDIKINETYNLTVKCEPAAAGLIEGSLVVTHSGTVNPKETKMRGTGVPVAIISLSDTTYDFGKKLTNNQQNHDVTVENTGTDLLSVSSLSFTGTGSSAYSISAGDAPFDLQPGLTHTFTISFSPSAVGVFSAELNISHSAVNESNPMLYTVVGEGIDVNPQITLSETSPWDFGSIATTMPGLLALEISNTGTDPLKVSSATLQTGAEFVVDSLLDSNGGAINFPYTLQVSEKIYLWIKFVPSAKTTYNDTLSIVHDGINEASPMDIAITGTGRDEIVKTFSYTGAVQQFTLPTGVTTIKVEALGGEGGNAAPYGSLMTGGLAGKVSAEFTLSPGTTLNVYVGGKGADGTTTGPGAVGWNGGGVGAFDSAMAFCGGSGGGASDIRIGGTDYADRIIVAGAGGGAGNYMNMGEYGGAGGDLVGENGYFTGMYDPMTCGGGGTQSAGGAAAQMGGSPGVLGEGGAATNSNAYNGGGGGAGYYGGGGGGAMGGGGGGSSYTGSGASNVSHKQGDHSGDGEITITY